jgi:hypothetical protein
MAAPRQPVIERCITNWRCVMKTLIELIGGSFVFLALFVLFVLMAAPILAVPVSLLGVWWVLRVVFGGRGEARA